MCDCLIHLCYKEKGLSINKSLFMREVRTIALDHPKEFKVAMMGLWEAAVTAHQEPPEEQCPIPKKA